LRIATSHKFIEREITSRLGSEEPNRVDSGEQSEKVVTEIRTQYIFPASLTIAETKRLEKNQKCPITIPGDIQPKQSELVTAHASQPIKRKVKMIKETKRIRCSCSNYKIQERVRRKKSS
jgi:hypothetical protein